MQTTCNLDFKDFFQWPLIEVKTKLYLIQIYTYQNHILLVVKLYTNCQRVKNKKISLINFD